MKIRDSRGRDVDIATAIACTIEQAGYDDGKLEQISSTVEKCGELLSKLIQMLHENNHLTDAQIKNMLGFRYSVVQDDKT